MVSLLVLVCTNYYTMYRNGLWLLRYIPIHLSLGKGRECTKVSQKFRTRGRECH